jgi:hypothetical protein
MIPAKKDLPSGQFSDILQILLTLFELSPPAVVADQDEGIVGLYRFRAVFLEFQLMLSPNPISHLRPGFQLRLEMQMQISKCKKAHFVSCMHLFTALKGSFDSIRYQGVFYHETGLR